MRDLERSAAAGRIQIGVEHAAHAAELELETAALADLQSRSAEAPDQILRRQPDEAPRLPRLGSRRRLRASVCCGAVAQAARRSVSERAIERRIR